MSACLSLKEVTKMCLSVCLPLKEVTIMGDNTESLHFSCHKCRTPIFSKNDVLTHALDAVRTVFKVHHFHVFIIQLILYFDL